MPILFLATGLPPLRCHPAPLPLHSSCGLAPLALASRSSSHPDTFGHPCHPHSHSTMMTTPTLASIAAQAAPEERWPLRTYHSSVTPLDVRVAIKTWAAVRAPVGSGFQGRRHTRGGSRGWVRASTGERGVISAVATRWPDRSHKDVDGVDSFRRSGESGFVAHAPSSYLRHPLCGSLPGAL